ncbi:MAG: hypothetical protein EBZ69_01550 [Alphaproteobacteria bacterium]|nr:hypothetical protein [Alphaproteobacteria bacterium]
MTPSTSSPAAYLLPASIRDQLLAYLVTRPYAEVAGGVAAIQGLAPAPDPVPAAEPAPEPALVRQLELVQDAAAPLPGHAC